MQWFHVEGCAVDPSAFRGHAQHPTATQRVAIVQVYAEQQSHLEWNCDVLEDFEYIFYMALLQPTL